MSLKLDYTFSDPGLLHLAMSHRSVGRPNNERLEFLGDALVNLLVGEMLFTAHPHADEGELSRMRAQLVSGAGLAEVARGIDLGASLLLGSGELKSGGQRRGSILADAFEALLAAVYLDGGFEACRGVVRGLFAGRVEALPRARKDAKTTLQEWLQARGFALPDYTLVDERGQPHARTFEVTCRVEQPQVVETTAGGHSHRAAEQAAAAALLATLTGVSQS